MPKVLHYGKCYPIKPWQKFLLFCIEKGKSIKASLIIEICSCTLGSNATLEKFPQPHEICEDGSEQLFFCNKSQFKSLNQFEPSVRHSFLR